jgi:hypothetical protein
MYKFYSKNGQAQFYEHGVEIDGTVYGIQKDSDILRIKRNIIRQKRNISDENEDLLSGSVNLPDNKFAETDDNFDMDTEIAKIQHTSIIFKQPTSEQLSQIQSKTFDSMSELKQHVQSVMNGETMSQDEINAMLLLKIAEMEVAITNEQTTN